MMRPFAKSLCILVLVVQTARAGGQASDKPIPAPRPIAGLENDFDVAYLPERLRGTFEDRWLKLNVHWHQGGSPRACLVFVHGGGYAGGDKDGGFRGAGGPDRKTMELAAQQGFAVVNLNYILGNGSVPQIFPQVYWDFKAAIRFLRAHAGKYNIDPCRIGAVGFSAGGWLISSSCYPETDELMTRQRRFAARDVLDTSKGTTQFAKDRLLLTALDDAEPPHGRYSARVQAVSFDFFQHFERMTPAAPATQVWLGLGGRSKVEAYCKNAGIDFSPAELVGDRFKGQDILHVPPMTSATRSADGKSEVELRARILEFFHEQLVKNPRTPAVEFRPNRRVFSDQQVIEMIVSAPDIAIHFTTDGSEPTASSPRYKAPIPINATTTFKAVALREGARASGIATAKFSRGQTPPTITGPADIPRAKVGQPFAIRFAKKEEGAAVWSLGGHLTPMLDKKSKQASPANGLALDPERGVLAGTPQRPGTFTFQVQCACAWGQLADTRTHVLVVEP